MKWRNKTLAIKDIETILGDEGDRESAAAIFTFLRDNKCIVEGKGGYDLADDYKRWVEEDDDNAMSLWTSIVDFQAEPGLKVVEYLVKERMFSLVRDVKDFEGDMEDHYPVWADRTRSAVVGLRKWSDDDLSRSDMATVAGEGGEYDEVDNEFYAEDALENRVRVSPSVLKALKQVKLDEEKSSLNATIQFLIDQYKSS
jgi:hypothetical protein